jgi:Cu/Ag efflux pump CusA
VRDRRGDEGALRDILIPIPGKTADGRPRIVPLEQIADVRFAQGPATIKSETGSSPSS